MASPACLPGTVTAMNILALDLGTSSVRGLVLDADAEPLPGALARRKVHLDTRRRRRGHAGRAALPGLPGGVPGRAVRRRPPARRRAGRRLGAVALGAAAGRRGAPLGPVLTWLDTRPGRPRARRPGRPGGVPPAHRRLVAPFLLAVRLPWLRAGAGSPLARFAGLAEYVLGDLLDEAPMSVSQASGTGLLDLRALAWDAEACGWPASAPASCPRWRRSAGGAGCAPEYARRWPELAGARVDAAGRGRRGVQRRLRAASTRAGRRSRWAPRPRYAWSRTLRPVRRCRRCRDGCGATGWTTSRIVTGAAYSGGGNLFAWAAGAPAARGRRRWRRRWPACRPGRRRHGRPAASAATVRPGLAPAGSG